MRIYVNGTLENTTTSVIQSFNYNPDSFEIIGGTNENDFNQPFTGNIDNLRFYGRTINASEVSALFTTDPECVSTVSLLKSEDNDYFDLYPNPSNGKFSIRVSKHIKNDILVYNVLGEIVLRINAETELRKIDLSEKPSGIYFAKLKVGERLLTKKFIKE